MKNILYSVDKKEHILDQSMIHNNSIQDFIPNKRIKITPPTTERVMIYARQENENTYTPLHILPPTTEGLLNAVSN